MGIGQLAAPDGGGHHVGQMLRTWRQRRRLSQLELASVAEVSTRHLSYVETGKSTPSRELVRHLAEHLDVPHRERNDLLLAAGYAPAHLTLDLDDPAMADVRAALDAVLAGSGDHPTLVMDRRWDLVDANSAALAWTTLLPPALLEPPINVVRATLHPDGLASVIENLAEVRTHLHGRLERQHARTADTTIAELLDEVDGYPASDPRGPSVARSAPAMPVVMTVDGVTTRYISVVSTFGSPLDVTAAELTIETFYAVG